MSLGLNEMPPQGALLSLALTMAPRELFYPARVSYGLNPAP